MRSIALFFKKMSIEKALLMSSIGPLLTTLLNMRQILLALAIIIILDMLTGIRKSLFLKKVSMNMLRKNFWKTISSAGLRATWRKTYEYGIGILVFVVLDSLVLKTSNFELLGGAYTLSEMAVALACGVEIYSVFENMEAVSSNNLLKKMFAFIPSKFKNFFKPSEEKA